MAVEVAKSYTGTTMADLAELQQALNTAHFEINYEKSTRIVQEVTKDEEIRKLKFSLAIKEDEIEELNEQLGREEERADHILEDLEDANTWMLDLDADVQKLLNEVCVKTRELETARAEVEAMSGMSNDSTKVLKEKLALAREMANLKPELEHLRSQAASNQELLSEKLSLQRRLTTVQVELENAQRTASRAATKAGKSGDKNEEFAAQIERLREQLREAKQATKDSTDEIDSLRKELAATKKFAQTAASKQGKDQVVSVDVKSQLDTFEKKLAAEKKERERAEKALGKEQQGWEAQRTSLEDKLASFRAKLKSTKEKLKESEAELKSARDIAARPKSRGAKDSSDATGTAATKKRHPALSSDPDAAIGTPGDHVAAKRGRKVANNVGDKSTFSITPFLNRTMSLAPESPPSGSKKRKADEAEELDAGGATSEASGEEATPSAAATKATKKARLAAKERPKALAPVSSAKQNSKAATKRNKTSATHLEKVTEEPEPDSVRKPTSSSSSDPPLPSKESENTAPAAENAAYKENTTTTKVSLNMVPKVKSASHNPKPKPRKSLLEFKAFTDEPAAVKQQPKKRKLLNSSSSGLGKTLFDDEEEGEEAVRVKPIPGRGLFAKRGVLGGLRKGVAKGPLVTAEDGFMFSPLKRDRKAAALAQSMLGN